MAKLVYCMNVSLDGYVADAAGSPGWATVDEEIHEWFNEQQRGTALELYGRRLWETMAPYWPHAESDPNATDWEREYGRIWLATPRVVFSRTLESVDWGARLVKTDPVEEFARLRGGLEADDEISVAGPTLAAPFVERDLVDEYRVLVHPTVLGDGLPFWPPVATPRALELTREHRFGSGVVLLTYRRPAA